MRNFLKKLLVYSSLIAFIGAMAAEQATAVDFNLSGPVNRVIIRADNESDRSSSVTEREFEAHFGMPFGKISIGQGDGAASGSSEVDLSGISVIMYSGVKETSDSLTFRDRNVAKLTGDTDIGDTRSNFDGFGHNDRLRYDTPNFGGVVLSGSITKGDAWELAASYASEFQGLGKFSVAIGYVNTVDSGNAEFSQFGGSISWLHTTGINLTVAYGSRDVDGDDKDLINYFGKLGYKFGKNAVAMEYGMTEDFDSDFVESSNYGVAYVTNPWDGIEFYGTFRVYQLDRDGVPDIVDINQIMVGMRIKF